MKKALIHDWFSVYAGAEKCVESFTNIWEDFEIYSLILRFSSEKVNHCWFLLLIFYLPYLSGYF